ncbi:uncharacterized protein LOC143631487 [Bidens hawaiensis]|uniref:uncharacterized protein LOC143631487 n=1 Tax=Bidens hawaiensis TaxID=980011 RepID=UPI0040499DE2
MEQVRGIKTKHQINFIAIQETQMVDISKINIGGFWDNSHFNFVIQGSTGRSGGLIYIWDEKVFKKRQTLCTRNYILIEGTMKGVDGVVFVVNVYAPQETSLKKDLWEELNSLKNEKAGVWIFLGDFNCVRDTFERKNSAFCAVSASDFNSFIVQADLTEYKMGGGLFTFLSEVGGKCSKIDRILVGHDFVTAWPNATLLALPKKYSDHRPVILSCVDIKSGPKPFKFFNSWLRNKDLEGVILEAFRGCRVSGPPDLCFTRKLKACKNAIKKWRFLVNKEETDQKGKWSAKINELDSLSEVKDFTESEVNERLECKLKLAEFERCRLLDLKQRARINWAIDGDENSAYFHGIINCHKNTNNINGLILGVCG